MAEARVAVHTKVAALRQPATYPGNPERVDTIETHMSWVFLAGQTAYKMKKPVRYGCLDFSSLEARWHYCMEELRLNRRLAEAVYLEVVALRIDPAGTLRIGGEGTVVEWLVKMRRLPSHLMLDRMLQEGRASADHLRSVSQQLAEFYRGEPAAAIDAATYRDRLAREIDECERELCDPAFALPAREVRELCAGLRAVLQAQAGLFEARVAAGRVVEGHGDLRPEHVYLGVPPAIIDRVEFSAEVRTQDTADELAFLALECERLGAPRLGRVLLDTYAQLSGDAPAGALIHFYQGLRSCVRAKLSIWHLRELQYRNSPKWPARARQYLQLGALHMRACEAALPRGGPRGSPTLPAAA